MAHILLRFQSGAVGHVYLDYVERPSSHDLKIIGREGKIYWNNEDGKAYLYRADNEPTIYAPSADFDRNDLFLAEMAHFLSCLTHEADPVCTLADGRRVLEIILAAKTSAATKKEIDV